jgi:hypothetical protein
MLNFLKENWLFILLPLVIVLGIVIFLIMTNDSNTAGFHYNI